MEDLSKAFFYFIAVVVVGFVIVFFSKQGEDSKKMTYALMATGNMLNTYARDKCTVAAERASGNKLYEPTDSQSDGTNYVKLLWKFSKNGDHTISCNYENAKGVTELTIDGVAQKVDSAESDAVKAARSSGAPSGADASHNTGH